MASRLSPAASSSSSESGLDRLDAIAEVRPERRQVGGARERGRPCRRSRCDRRGRRRPRPTLHVPWPSTPLTAHSIALEQLTGRARLSHRAGEGRCYRKAMSDSPASTSIPSRRSRRGCSSTTSRARTSVSTSSSSWARWPRMSTSTTCDARGSGSPTDTRSCAPGSAGSTATNRNRRSSTHVEVPLAVHDLRDLSGPADRRLAWPSSSSPTGAPASRPGRRPALAPHPVPARAGRQRFVFTYHHALLDTSVVWITEEALRSYDAIRHGEVAELIERRPYREHIEWLHEHLNADRRRGPGLLRRAARRLRRPDPTRRPRRRRRTPSCHDARRWVRVDPVPSSRRRQRSVP